MADRGQVVPGDLSTCQMHRSLMYQLCGASEAESSHDFLASSSEAFALMSAYPFLFTADTRYTVEDIEGALLKQMKASKDTSIAVKKPEDENIRFTNYGNSMWT